MELFKTPISSSIVIALTIVYAICAAITTFDTRIIQAKKNGYLPANKAHIPEWTGVFAILMWLTWIAIFLLNWWYAFLLFVIKFALKLLPVLENIGALIMLPIVGKETASSVNIVGREQKRAARTLKQISKSKSKEDFHEALKKYNNQ